MDKDLVDITAEDLRECPEWYFPMDETVEHEGIARPCLPDVDVSPNLLRIFRCLFVDGLGREFEGFVFYYEDERLSARQPTLWAFGNTFSFWFGIVAPPESDLRRAAEAFPPSAWPIRYRTDPRLGEASMSGEIGGLYYLENGEERRAELTTTWS
jgi:hypothetical protein